MKNILLSLALTSSIASQITFDIPCISNNELLISFLQNDVMIAIMASQNGEINAYSKTGPCDGCGPKWIISNNTKLLKFSDQYRPQVLNFPTANRLGICVPNSAGCLIERNCHVETNMLISCPIENYVTEISVLEGLTWVLKAREKHLDMLDRRRSISVYSHLNAEGCGVIDWKLYRITQFIGQDVGTLEGYVFVAVLCTRCDY